MYVCYVLSMSMSPCCISKKNGADVSPVLSLARRRCEASAVLADPTAQFTPSNTGRRWSVQLTCILYSPITHSYDWWMHRTNTRLCYYFSHLLLLRYAPAWLWNAKTHTQARRGHKQCRKLPCLILCLSLSLHGGINLHQQILHSQAIICLLLLFENARVKLSYHTVCIDVNTRKNLPLTTHLDFLFINDFSNSLCSGRVVYLRWWTACSVVDAHLVPLSMFCYSRSVSSIGMAGWHCIQACIFKVANNNLLY